jgi:hypothetical protein
MYGSGVAIGMQIIGTVRNLLRWPVPKTKIMEPKHIVYCVEGAVATMGSVAEWLIGATIALQIEALALDFEQGLWSGGGCKTRLPEPLSI